MITNLHHVAILTSNIEESVKYYVELLGCKSQDVVEVNRTGVNLRSARLPIGERGNTYLQIIEPKEGPGVKELAEGGEGTLFEMAFQVDDAEEFADKMVTKGIMPSDVTGRPIDGKYTISKFGNRYFILPGDKMKGTRIEIVQVI